MRTLYFVITLGLLTLLNQAQGITLPGFRPGESVLATGLHNPTHNSDDEELEEEVMHYTPQSITEDDLVTIADSVDRVSSTVEAMTAHAVGEYSKWYRVNAILWCLGSVLTVALTFALVGYIYKKHPDLIEDLTGLGSAVLLLGVGSMLVFCSMIVTTNLPTVIHPEGYAIHSLLRDIKR